LLRSDLLTLTAPIDPAEIPSLGLVPQLRYDFSGISLQLCDSLGTVTAEQRTATPIMLPNEKNPEVFRGAMINDQI